MRENIGLYKAKRKDNGDWVEGYYLFVKEQNKHYILTGKTRNYPIDLTHPHLTLKGFEWLEIDQETLCECIGLKYENGKLIFENDILKIILQDTKREAFFIIKYGEFKDINADEDDIFLGWYIQNIKNKECFTIFQENKIFFEYAEYVSNKFDNKELLGE